MLKILLSLIYLIYCANGFIYEYLDVTQSENKQAIAASPGIKGSHILQASDGLVETVYKSDPSRTNISNVIYKASLRQKSYSEIQKFEF